MHLISVATLFCQNTGSSSMRVQGVSQKSGMLGHKDSSKLGSFQGHSVCLIENSSLQAAIRFLQQGICTSSDCFDLSSGLLYRGKCEKRKFCSFIKRSKMALLM